MASKESKYIIMVFIIINRAIAWRWDVRMVQYTSAVLISRRSLKGGKTSLSQFWIYLGTQVKISWQWSMRVAR
jgi:hypothetical protein